MTNVTIAIMIVLLLIVLLLAGSVWLQIFLSKKKNKWLGLIIPIICFVSSILIVFSLSIYTSEITTVTETTDGVVIRENTTPLEADRPSVLSILLTVIPVFIISNIPTVIFLAIYFACREKLKLRNQLDKMNIQDLE